MHHIPDNVFLIAARELAACVTDEDLERGSLYPPLSHIREVSLRIAVGVTKYAYCKGKLNKPLYYCCRKRLRIRIADWCPVHFRLLRAQNYAISLYSLYIACWCVCVFFFLFLINTRFRQYFAYRWGNAWEIRKRGNGSSRYFFRSVIYLHVFSLPIAFGRPCPPFGSSVYFLVCHWTKPYI